MIRETGIVGCILAGGKSSRMGSDKSLLPLAGVPLIERIALVMREVFESVVVVSDRRDEYKFLGLSILQDIKKDSGPLGGIHAALVQTKADHLFVVACDMPFVSAELIRHVVSAESGANATVPTMNGQLQPLCGLYSRTCLAIVERSLNNETYKLQSVLEELQPTIVPLTPGMQLYAPNLLDNLNTPAEAEQAFHRTTTAIVNRYAST
jgi:molybdopterin-guanine dinucleotide biosynthesis protein A